jgi:hypothetical protein
VNVAETLLIYAGIPLAIIAVLALFTLRPDPQHRRRRYRPGQPWEHEPVWYAPHSGRAPAAHDGDTKALGSSVYTEHHGSDASTHGATRALTSGERRPARAAGPLGGARGTW